jgi:hypothetical protein
MIKTLRLQLSIRLFSLCPNEDAKNFLRNAYELIERSKKQEALCRSQQLKENKGIVKFIPFCLLNTTKMHFVRYVWS